MDSGGKSAAMGVGAALGLVLAGIGGATFVARTQPAVRLPPGVCARAPSDGGTCFSRPGGTEVAGRAPGDFRLGGGTYTTGAEAVHAGAAPQPTVYGQCELFDCPPQP